MEEDRVEKLSRAGNLCNELFEFSDRLVQVRPDADWRSDGLALQIHNVNLHHHLCGQSETHPRRRYLNSYIHQTGVILQYSIQSSSDNPN